MTNVSEHLSSMIRRQLDEKGIVVWYDPEKSYSGFVQGVSFPDTEILRYSGSFFKLRHAYESHLDWIDPHGRPKKACGIPPRLLLYVPLDRQDTNNALIEAEAAGTIMEPGARSQLCNTRLKVLSQHVFKAVAPDQVENIGRQAEQGLLNIDDLDRLSDEVGALGTATLKLIFGTTAIEGITLVFATSDKLDAKIVAKKAAEELAAFFHTAFGIPFDTTETPADLRNQLKKGLLVAEFLSSLPAGETPEVLGHLALAATETQIENIQAVCKAWRNRLDYRQAFAETARNLETTLRLSGINWNPQQDCQSLVSIETFPAIENKLFECADGHLLEGRPGEALLLAEKRQTTFWPGVDASFQLRWALIECAAQVLTISARIRQAIAKNKKATRDIIIAYTDAHDAWCLLDTWYRKMEHHYVIYDLDLGSHHDRLQKVMAKARNDYTLTVEQEIDVYLQSLIRSDFHVEGLLTQDAVFSQLVQTLLSENKKTAYILVDSLRFEMGHELAQGLSDAFSINVQSAIGQLPAITSVGMGALLPGAERELELVVAGSKVVPVVGQSIMKTRSDRIKHIQTAVSVNTAVCKLNELNKPSKKLQTLVDAAQLVVVTSQEIDRWGEEGGGEDEVRVYMDEVLEKLAKGVRRLATMGVTHIVIVSDHGHLFGENFEGGQRMDPPGGNTAELHERAWIGRGGSKGDGYLRLSAHELGLGGDLELAFPLSLACFKTKGAAGAYCHGGISLQEMVIPIVTLEVKPSEQDFANVELAIEMSAPKITNRFFSVQVSFREKGLFSTEEIRVQVFLKAGRREVGYAAVASYGYDAATREIALRRAEPNHITLLLNELEGINQVSIHILDAVSQVELAKLKNVAVDISI